MKEKYQKEIRSMLAELAKKSARLALASEDKLLSVGGLNKAQELTSLASDIERAIFVVLSAKEGKK